jgi:hypothetical protein
VITTLDIIQRAESVLCVTSDKGNPASSFPTKASLGTTHFSGDLAGNGPQGTFDVICINGDPSDTGTYNNVKHAYELLNNDGIIIGECYNWQSVQTGLKQFTLETGIPYTYLNEEYMIKKGTT